MHYCFVGPTLSDVDLRPYQSFQFLPPLKAGDINALIQKSESSIDTIIIVDEAQNITLDNMRTLMTRIGDNSKMVILGDVKQKDLRNKKDSSLEVIIDKFNNVDNFGCVELRDPNDVVRNPIIKVIENVFDDLDETVKTKKGLIKG